MWDCGVAAVERLKPLADGRAVEIKAQTSHVAMDVIFRTLFSVSIDDKIANAAFEAFRGRKIMPGSQVILSPWHLHRHERLWGRPDAFDPTRFETPNGKACLHTAYIPFSVGPARLSRFGFCHGQRGLAAVNAGAGLPL
jgi:cytochrome P450